MNASVDESGDHVGRNAAAGSPSDDAGSCDTPTGTRSFASPPSASAIRALRPWRSVGEPDEREVLAVGRCCGLVVARPVGDRGRLLTGHHDEDVAFLRVVQALLHGGRRGRVGRGRRRGATRGRRRRCHRRRGARVRVVAAARHRAEEHGERPHEQADTSHPVRVGVDGQRTGFREGCAETFRLRHDDACGASVGGRARGPSGSPRWRDVSRAPRRRPDRSRFG